MSIKGVIFPDLNQMLIETRLIKSDVDMHEKLHKIAGSQKHRGCQVFRDWSDIEKGFQGENKSICRSEVKDAIKKMIKSYKTLWPVDSECKLKLTLSDFRLPGNYLGVKAFLSGYESSVSDYVLYLCEKEKNSLSDLNKISDHHKVNKNILSYIENIFYISREDLVSNSPYVLLIHQYLHLFSILEFELYGKDAKQFNAIKKLLPGNDDKGHHRGSIENLLTSIRLKLGFDTQDKFIDALCMDGINQHNTIKTKLNRWKSGKSLCTPGRLNELLCNPRNKLGLSEGVQAPLVIIAIVLDQLYSNCLGNGMTADLIQKEFEKYELYQNIPFNNYRRFSGDS